MTIKRAGIVYGLITGLLILLYGLFTIYIKQDVNQSTISIVTSVILMGGMAYALLEFRKYNQGYITVKEAFGINFYVSLFAGMGLGLYSYYLLTYIDQSLLLQLQRDQLKVLEENGYAEKELMMIKQQIGYIVTPIFFFFVNIIATLFQGILIGTMMSLILRKLPESN